MNQILVEKVPVQQLIALLTSLAEQEIEYVDLLVSNGTSQDGFAIIVREAYKLNNDNDEKNDDDDFSPDLNNTIL